MQFSIRQRFDHPADRIGAAYADPLLYPTLVGLPKLGDIDVLRHEPDGRLARLWIRFAFTGHLPGAVTSVIDPARLTWVQESVHDLASGTTTFRLLPDHYPDRLQADGAATVTTGSTGTLRTVTGTLRVRAPLVAGKVERAIVSGLAEYLEAEAPAVDRFLDG